MRFGEINLILKVILNGLTLSSRWIQGEPCSFYILKPILGKFEEL